MCFKRVVENVKQAAKKELKVYVREFEYDTETIMERESRKHKTANQAQTDEEALSTTCSESFKDVYASYIHIKVLKVIIDSYVRFASHEDYLVAIISVQKGKERKLHQNLINQFSDASKRDMYGTKEDLMDTEDFFPYSFAEIGIPAEK